MSSTDLRKLKVDNDDYLWRIHHYFDSWAGRLVVYSTAHKTKRLEVHFTYKMRKNSFPQSAIYRWTGEHGLPKIQQTVTAVRIIRYARRQLNWQSEKNTAPLVIEDGYALLRDIGYEPAPYPECKRKSKNVGSSDEEQSH